MSRRPKPRLDETFLAFKDKTSKRKYTVNWRLIRRILNKHTNVYSRLIAVEDFEVELLESSKKLLYHHRLEGVRNFFLHRQGIRSNRWIFNDRFLVPEHRYADHEIAVIYSIVRDHKRLAARIVQGLVKGGYLSRYEPDIFHDRPDRKLPDHLLYVTPDGWAVANMKPWPSMPASQAWLKVNEFLEEIETYQRVNHRAWNVKEVWLFGSLARHALCVNDIDICIEYEDNLDVNNIELLNKVQAAKIRRDRARLEELVGKPFKPSCRYISLMSGVGGLWNLIDEERDARPMLIWKEGVRYLQSSPKGVEEP